MIDDFEVVVREIASPSCLSGQEQLSSHEVSQIVVVCPDLDVMGRSEQIMMPVFKGFDDG